MSLSDLTDYLAALNSDIEEFLDSNPTEVTPEQKEKLLESLQIVVKCLKGF